ncbi:unnamed protein product [Hydatigera taeniaeformis]|uniref:Dolichyl-diphosphooligosaccharide--protein glycosyltransferase subunit 1 n=1 Tax=Hydatigena taeniaeformis TaxID=6205 RepID=A0A0R3WX81_HYDTA|nr:unnamed protein product [Hydatigera taeniaeformis]
MHIVPFLILLLVFAFGRSEFVNTDVAQTVYADSHIIRIDAEITLDLSEGPVGMYHYAIDPDISDHLSFIEAKINSKTSVPVERISEVSNVTEFVIRIPAENSGKRFKFTVSSFFTGLLKPKPAKILQADKQLVEFVINVGYFSVYPSQRVTTTVVLSPGDVLFYTIDLQPVHKTASRIKYGPFENAPPFDKVII